MKKIIYELLQGVDSDGNPVLSSVELGYSEANLAIAEKEAYNGYTVEDDGQPEPEPPAPDPSEDSVWDELDAAYQAGYHEGYTEGVNSAYD